MAARLLGLAAALGLAANAFLLPPSVSTDDINTDSDLSAWLLLDHSNLPLLVPCKGCETDASGSKDLLLNISTGSQPGTLELGGKPFYPPFAFMLDGPLNKPTALAAPQGESLIDMMRQPDKYTRVDISGWTFSVDKDKTPTVLEDGEELLELTLHITNVDQDSVAMPNIELRVLKDPEMGSLTILSMWVDDGLDLDHANKPVCETALCHWRQFIEDKVHGISAAAHKKFGSGRPCPGKMMDMMKDGKPPGAFTNMHHGPGSHHHRPIGETGRPHHHHGHPMLHHGAHHKFHRFMHRVGRFIMAVAIPILIGVAAGILSYAIGMAVGCAAALIWIKVFRGGKRGYASVAQTEDGAAAKALEAETEPRESLESAPPLYEDAPAYEEKEVV